jgi:60 kDa SS-A/Ro ribonucleoprotein
LVFETHSTVTYLPSFYLPKKGSKMKSYTQIISDKNTPQTQPLPLRTDMVKNNAGGYVFEVSNEAKFQRFLLLGTTGGTFYAGERELTEEATKFLISQIKANGLTVLATTDRFVKEKRILKLDTALYILALAVTHGDSVTKQAGYDYITQWCNTGTHLMQFVSMVNDLRGWSAGLRKGVARWYDGMSFDRLVYQTLKYQNRSGFTHKDIMRLAHPKASSEEVNEYYKFLVGKPTKTSHFMFNAWNKAKSATTNDEVISAIKDGRLAWEMIPTERLNEPEVLSALVDTMPAMALIRQLNRLTYTGTLEKGDTLSKIYTKLTNADEIKSSGIHPIFVLSAIKTYGAGKGDKGSKTWTPNQRIMDALHKTFELAFTSQASAPISGVKTLIAVDVSASMRSPASGTNMLCTEASAALGLTNLKQIVDSEFVLFDTSLYASGLGSRHSYDEALKAVNKGGGGTDCSLPFQYALGKKKQFDVIVIYTDSETWAGRQHGKTLLDEYRRTISPNCKVIEVALQHNSFTGYPAEDTRVLRTVGFDANLPQIINKFATL